MNSKRHSNDPTSRQEHKNAHAIKQHAKQLHANQKERELYNEEDQIYDDTMTKPLLVSKIKFPLDDEETKKGVWENKHSTQPHSGKKTPSEDSGSECSGSERGSSEEQEMLEIPFNKRVEDILANKPLRERLGGLLEPQQLLPLAFNHHQLLKRMELIDRTIDFLSSHRGMKVIYFETVKKSIFETGNTLIEYANFQQLLFLDPSWYELEWKMNEKVRRYDLKITLPTVQSMDQRKAEMRSKIIEYSIQKEAEFLTAKGLTKQSQSTWHEDFPLQQIEIPKAPLPAHPNSERSDLQTIQKDEIKKVGNPAIKMLFQCKQNQSEAKSISGASVADMIFSRMPARDITARLMESIREREKQNKLESEKVAREGIKIDKGTMVKICEDLLLVYMSKNVSNMFKTTLLEMLESRLSFKNEIISESVDRIIRNESLGFLREKESSQRLKVVSMDRQKYRAARQYYEENES